MNEQQTNQAAAAEPGAYERCLCRELVDNLRGYLGISPAVRRHLTNSRIELLKAVREVIDRRIEHLSSASQQGTKVPVE